MTVRDAVADATTTLVGAGFPAADARIDAAVLARHLLGWTLTDWVARDREPVPAGFTARLSAAVTRRTHREPVAYITSEKEFFGRPFQVNRAVLIPRPETEWLVDAALEAARQATSPDGRGSGPLILDIGTGSGCLAITLALECPAATVVGTDVSAQAIAMALNNADRLRATNVRFALVGDDEFVPAGAPALDIIVSNPPYVPLRDRPSLAPDVVEYEPALALFGGQDGLDVIRQLVPAAAARLRRGGWLMMEIGAGQEPAVLALVAAGGLAPERSIQDLQGIPRVIRARRG